MIKTSIVDPDLALRIVRGSPIMAYDTETSGLQSGRDFICGYVFTDYDHSVYVPVRHEPGGNIVNVGDFERELADAFQDRHRRGFRTVGHFLGFDLRMSLWHGIQILGPLEDTAINEALIDDQTKGYGLDDCAIRHQVTHKRGQEMYAALAARFGGVPDRKQMQHFWRMPGDDPNVLDYATGDGVSTLELRDSQSRILNAQELRVPWQLECDLIPYTARLHRRGIRVDADYAEKLQGVIKDEIAKANSVFAPGFNVRAPSEVEKLYRINGYTDDQFDRTATGKVSFTESWLETNEIGQAILEVRRMEKARDSFATPLTTTHNINGRVHPVLHQSKTDENGVAGSRYSCSDPNLQAFPKRNKKVGKVVRGLIVPDPGMVLEEGDAIQQEPRLFTHYSGDKALMHGYSTDPEFSIHQRANDMMFGGQDYDKAKRMAMGILSMMYPKTLSGHLRISVKEATDLRNKFLYDAFPDIGEFQRLAVKVFEDRGYVKSILGRRARLESSRFAYKAVSRIIQNSAGDHLKTVVLRACQFEDAHPEVLQVLLTIHDSVIWQRDPSKVKELKEFIAALENVPHEPQFNLSVPIPFEIGSGLSWTEASYGEKIKSKKGWHI